MFESEQLNFVTGAEVLAQNTERLYSNVHFQILYIYMSKNYYIKSSKILIILTVWHDKVTFSVFLFLYFL